MKFQYSEKKVKLPGNVHAYAEKKVMKLARYFEEDAEALIVFSVEKNRNNVELTVHGAGTWSGVPSPSPCGILLSHKKNEILPFATIGMALEGFIFSELSQAEKDKHIMLSLICGI